MITRQPTIKEAAMRLRIPTKTKSYQKKGSGRPNWSKEAGDLWSLIVRARAGGCEICGVEADFDTHGPMVKGMDAHHICSRKNYLHRYNLNNGVCLCPSCHQFNPNWSPHWDLPSVEGFMLKMSTLPHLAYRNDWYNEHGHDRGLLGSFDKVYQENQYYKLLHVYIDMIDGEAFPNEPQKEEGYIWILEQ